MEVHGKILRAPRAVARRARDEAGQSLIVVIVGMMVFLGIAALAIDLSTLWAQHHDAQLAADAGALAGAQDVVNGTANQATVTTDANSFVTKNDPLATDTVTTPYDGDSTAVKVVVTKSVSLGFAHLFGLGSATVTASAVASSDLTTPLAYFGSSDSDLQDGSSTSDGWDNFCADNDSESNSNSTSDSDDPARCPASAAPENDSLNGWTVVHGGVDISLSNFYSPPGTSDQMVDLTGTCVEHEGNYPSAAGKSGTTAITVNGVTTDDDGYCENNSDGEIEESIPTIPGKTYTVTFWLGSNTWGYPYEKSLMAVASTQDLASLPAIADTNGDYNASYKTDPYGTSYPLENSSTWSSSTIIGHEQFFYYGPAGGDTDPDWQSETFTFTPKTTTTYLGFGALTNCAPDWTSTSSLNNSYFYPSSITSDSAGSVYGATTSSGFVTPPEEVNDDVQNPYQNQCKYGPGISDISVAGPNSIQLIQ